MKVAKVEVSKIKVKLGKDWYTGYYWIEPNKKSQDEIHVSYEGIRISNLINQEEADNQDKKAEQIFIKLLEDL